jgi:hypothetical protein
LQKVAPGGKGKDASRCLAEEHVSAIGFLDYLPSAQFISVKFLEGQSLGVA